jgi:hypothetical protein
MLKAIFFYELIEMKNKYPDAKFYLITKVAPDYFKKDGTHELFRLCQKCLLLCGW